MQMLERQGFQHHKIDFAQAKVLVVGDVMLDRYWFGNVERISPEAPVPVVHVGNTDDRLGGAANVARNIAALGGQVGLLGVVGADEPGAIVATLCESLGVRSFLQVDDQMPTTIKLRVISRQQQLLRVDFEEQPTHDVLLEKLDLYASLLSEYDLIILSDYGKGGLTHIERMITLARDQQKPILIDPKGDDYARYAGASVITPNRAELRQVIGQWRTEDELIEKAQTLRQALKLDALLLTRSEEGMTLFSKDQKIDFSAVAREVFDVSGAGDTVIAALAVMLACGFELQHAVDIANRAGGIVVGKLGTAVVTPEELFA